MTIGTYAYSFDGATGKVANIRFVPTGYVPAAGEYVNFADVLPPVNQVAINNIANWYWIVNDTNPTTQVYSTASNAYVAVSAAAFATWLTANNGAPTGTPPGSSFPIHGMQSNGGLIQLILATTAALRTGQKFNVSGQTGQAAATGNWVITVNDGTHVSLQGSIFNAGDPWITGGVLQGASIIDTDANLRKVINYQAILGQAVTSSGTVGITPYAAGSSFTSSATGITLTNPLSGVTRIQMTAAGQFVRLPPMDAFNSVPLGVPFVIENSGSFNFDLQQNGGSSIISGGLDSGVSRVLVLLENLNADGTLLVVGNDPGSHAAISVWGRSANSAGPNADISASAGSDGVLREKTAGVSQIAFGQIATGGISDQAVTFAKIQNVTSPAIIGRILAGTGPVAALTPAQVFALVAPPPPGGRLTLATGVPVMASTQSAKTVVYYTPYLHQFVPIYDGTQFVQTDTGGELSQLTTDTTKSPAAVAANSNYDIFVWNDSGTIRATRGPAWSSDTARGVGAGTTELERINGILLNKQAITNGPAADRGTYIGTIRSNGSSQIDYIFGGVAANGTAAVLGVWNMYNRVDVITMVGDSTDSWTYNSTTPRASNGSNTRRISFVCGLQEDFFLFNNALYSLGTATSAGVAGMGVDVTNAFSGIIAQGIASTATPVMIQSSYQGSFLGFHFIQECEAVSSGVAACTFYGDAGAPTILQSGMYGYLRM